MFIRVSISIKDKNITLIWWSSGITVSLHLHIKLDCFYFILFLLKKQEDKFKIILFQV
jgi:hypothetical protein